MKKLILLLALLSSFTALATKKTELDKLYIIQESFSKSSWGLLYSYEGQLYIQRSKICTLNDGRSGKCPSSATCSIENANDLTLCSSEVIPRAVENYFNRQNIKFSKDPKKLLQYIWNN